MSKLFAVVTFQFVSFTFIAQSQNEVVYLDSESNCITISPEINIEEECCLLWEKIEENQNTQVSTLHELEVCTESICYYKFTITDGVNIKDQTLYEIRPCNLEVSINPDPAIICNNEDLELNVIPKNATNYQWSSGVNNNIVNQAGEYTVTVTTEDGCGIASIDVKDASNPDQIKSLFEEQGFVCIPVEAATIGLFNNKDNSKSNQCGPVNDETEDGVIFTFKGTNQRIENLCEELEEALNNVDLCDASPSGLITDNSNFCNQESPTEFFASNQTKLQESGAGIWFHLWDDPNSNKDCLFVNTYGSQGLGGEIQNESFNTLIEALTENGDLNGHESISDLILNTLITEATSVSIDSIPQFEDQYMAPDGMLINMSLPLENGPEVAPCLRSGPFISISPAEIPVYLPEGTAPRFFAGLSWQDRVDSRALSGFTIFSGPKKGKYVGVIGKCEDEPYDCQCFKGYRKVGTKNEYYKSVDIASQFSSGALIPIYSGWYNNKQCPEAKMNINAGFFEYGGNFNSKGAGPLVESFNITTQDLRTFELNLCQTTTISSQNFNQPSYINFQPWGHPESIQDAGWIMHVRNSDNGVDYIYVEPLAPDGYQYYRYNCATGSWAPINAPLHPSWDLVGDLIKGIWLTTGSPAIHLSLDIIGTVIEQADIFNAALYKLEGNNLEAGMTLVFSAPFLDIIYKSGKWTIKIGNTVHDLVSMFFRYNDELGNVINVNIDFNKATEIAREAGIKTDEDINKYGNWLRTFAMQNAKHAQDFETDQRLANIWAIGNSKGLDEDQMTQLFKDICDDSNFPEIFNFFIQEPNLAINAWDFLKDTHHRSNISALSLYSDFNFQLFHHRYKRNNLAEKYPEMPLHESLALSYFSINNRTINNILFNPILHLSDEYIVLLDFMASALAKLPIENIPEVYRGVGVDEFNLLKHLPIGTIKPFNSFKYATTSIGEAGAFAIESKKMLKINNVECYSLTDFALNESPIEFLILPSRSYEILNHTTMVLPNTNIVIDLIILNFVR